MTVVFDASTLILGASDPEENPGSLAVQAILEPLARRHRFLSPALLLYEVGNVAFHKHPGRFGENDGERTRHAVALLGDVHLVPVDRSALARIGPLARGHGLSFYDAAYLELALREPDALLITEDRRLRTAGEQAMGPERCMDAATAWTKLEAGSL